MKNMMLPLLLVAANISFAGGVYGKTTPLAAQADKQTPAPEKKVAPSAVEKGYLAAPPDLPPEVWERVSQALKPATDDEIKATISLDKHVAQLKNQVQFGGVTAATDSETLSLSPGAQLPRVRTLPGVSTDVFFTDQLGNPWPIKRARPSNGDAFQLYEMSKNVIEISTLQDSSTGDVTVMLEGLDTPLKIIIVPIGKDKIVDLTRRFVIPGINPISAPQVAKVDKRMVDVKLDNTLNQFLSQTPPEDAIELNVRAPQTMRVWKYNAKLIILTRDDLQYPDASVNYGTDGWRIYSTSNPTPVLSLIHDGTFYQAYLRNSDLEDLVALKEKQK